MRNNRDRRDACRSGGGQVLPGLNLRLGTTGFVSSLPNVESFREFLETQARVRGSDGQYCKYTFKDREALIEIVRTIDMVLGNIPPDVECSGGLRLPPSQGRNNAV